MTPAEDLRNALDPVAFAKSRLGFSPDPWQSDVLRSPSPRLLLCCARQTGKSTIASVLALHTAIYDPGSLVLLVSPSLRQSGELFRKVLDRLAALDEQPALDEQTKLSMTFENGSRIVSLPASESTVRGFSGARLVIEDEAARVPDDLYRSVRPMLATSAGRLVLMSTPFGRRGHFWESWGTGSAEWQRVALRASECPRISQAFLDDERRALGERWFRQEYDCEFNESTDQVFGFDAVMEAVSRDVLPLFDAAPSLPGLGTASNVTPLRFE